MSSISCWTSATKCSNSSVSHPTSNSYPSTFSWSIHRWRYSSPLPILSALHFRASPSIRDSAYQCVVGFLELRGEGLQPGQKKAIRGRRHRAHKGRAKSRQRKLLRDCVLSFSPICLPLYTRWPVPLSALYLTSTSPTRHAPRRSRDLPRHTSSQASDDVQCHVGEGHPRNVQKVHG